MSQTSPDIIREGVCVLSAKGVNLTAYLRKRGYGPMTCLDPSRKPKQYDQTEYGHR